MKKILFGYIIILSCVLFISMVFAEGSGHTIDFRFMANGSVPLEGRYIEKIDAMALNKRILVEDTPFITEKDISKIKFQSGSVKFYCNETKVLAVADRIKKKAKICLIVDGMVWISGEAKIPLSKGIGIIVMSINSNSELYELYKLKMVAKSLGIDFEQEFTDGIMN